jgi:UDP-N-acetylmuramoyl-L-alanyl-D-glutamate--2,6-diaminopimelate ligase
MVALATALSWTPRADMRLKDLEHELASVASLGSMAFADQTSDPATLTVEITDVVHDSRAARPGVLFCAVPGLTVDGHDFVDAAVVQGAEAVLVQHPVQTDRPQMLTESVRQTMAHAAAIVHGHPSASLAVFGITGTNGKTTTTQLLHSIVISAGRRCAVIGTLGGVHTTPESPDLQRQFRSLVDDGGDVIALEVSSHALDQGRVDATQFAVAAFSNLTPDHLDYHRTMDAYFEAKKQLFDGRAKAEIINVDDPWGVRLADERPDAVRVSLDDITIDHESLAGTRFTWRNHETWVPLPGRMNVANALMAAEAALLLGMSEAQIVTGLANADSVPGRMQTVGAANDARPTVVVDYSHTPDSIEVALATLRAVAPHGRLSIVFGCGGDRDRQKRPLMAAAAEAGADHVYLTSDNPRSEDPMDIINDAVSGFETPAAVVIEPDRKTAIERAIIDAAAGDVVLIAGKGHEKTQTIGTDVFPFDDVRVASDLLEEDNS